MVFFRKSARHRRESAVAVAILGCIFTVVAFPVLFFNEGRAVKTAKALKEGAASVVSAQATRVDPANEGKFVHVFGKGRHGRNALPTPNSALA